MGDAAVAPGSDDERAGAPAGPPASAASEASGRVHLSQDEVEQVIARAVELQQDREAGRGTGLTLEDLQAVVAQVGVEPDLVRRALDEVRLPTDDGGGRGWADRVLGPRRVAGTGVVTGSSDEVGRAIATWMTSEEGLLLAGTRGGADRWVPDRRLLTKVRHGLQVTRSDSALRQLPSVTARTQAAPNGTLVAIEADTSPIRTSPIRTARAAVLSVSGLVGIGLGVATAVAVPDGGALAGDVAQFSAGLALPVVAGAGITAIMHHSWLGRVRRSVVRAIDGISMTQLGDAVPPASADWRDLRRRWLGGG
jgi:hypothetical protein